MVNLVSLFEASKNGNSVFFVGLIHQNPLESTFERRVFFDVLPVFIERGRTDTMQLTTCQGGLEHVTGIHRALGLTCPYHGMKLVDE